MGYTNRNHTERPCAVVINFAAQEKRAVAVNNLVDFQIVSVGMDIQRTEWLDFDQVTADLAAGRFAGNQVFDGDTLKFSMGRERNLPGITASATE